MKQSTLAAVAALAISLTTQTTAEASCYIPWLDPLAWIGFHGCGYGCCGHGGNNYGPRMYSAHARPHAYRTAAGPGCGCNGGAQTPTVSGFRRPATSYQPVTQYLPQTNYPNQFRPGPVYNYPQPAPGNTGYVPQPQTNVAALPPAGAYYGAMPSAPSTTVYGAPTIGGPLPAIHQHTSGIASPVPAGDIYGDHEMPVQSSRPVIRSSYSAQAPIRRSSYGVTPRSARSYWNIAR